MASGTAATKFKEEAICPICLELMTEPVSVDCGHSFCRACLTGVIENQGQETFHCALCRNSFTRESLRPNRQLESLIESFREMDQNICEEHGEKLRLFCEDDGQLICWCCERTPQHKEHVTTLVEDACQDYKTKLERAVTKLKQMQDQCDSLKMSMGQQITKWEETVKNQKQKIHSDFEKLYTFLQEEEKAYLSKLEKQKEETMERLQADNASLNVQGDGLKKHIQELERKCQDPGCKMLQNVKDALLRSASVTLDLPEPFSFKLHAECNVAERYLDVKKLLKSCQVNVTLDPDTAHPGLLVSEDRRCVTGPTGASSGSFCSVLGCEGFTSGRHYFEVDVGDGAGCGVGVCLENVQRDGHQKLEPLCGFWAIRLRQQGDCVALTSPVTQVPLEEPPRTVGVFLDCDAGLVSFYNMTTGAHIFSFPKTSFPETLRPFFQVCGDAVLSLPPPDKLGKE